LIRAEQHIFGQQGLGYWLVGDVSATNQSRTGKKK